MLYGSLVLSLTLFVGYVAAQYDYGETTAIPNYPNYPDYGATDYPTAVTLPPGDYGATDYGVPDYGNPTVPTVGGIDPGLYPNYDNYDVITQTPVISNPTTVAGPCNGLPKTIVNWYLIRRPSSVISARRITPIRHHHAYTAYRYPWSRVYGVAQYRVRSRVAPRRQRIGNYRSYRRGAVSKVMRYYW
ncbi:uncharacterized protein LOC110679240 [Aedes aegypti]|uniref:Uncharacterized protein n=1 Tax=Aedes aegypti TaxID=7159 RepID=A0A6I8U4H7_AEDAE|nr:uncharacterized protein LOC110679240 [Aedes aegypti]